MPEGLEAEIWCRAAQPLVGRMIEAVWCDERVAPDGLVEALLGEQMSAVRRAGKVLLVDTSGPTLGLHFGMTGRLVVDGRAPIERLEYASGADRAEWDRLRLDTLPVGAARPALRMNDPRRLGRLSLDPALDGLGPDLFEVTEASLRTGLRRRRSAVKTALLDQSVVAGLGNLCADEVLFWAGVAPTRSVDTLTGAELGAIAAACRDRLPVMLEHGGSTSGELSPARRASADACPLDGAPLERTTIGGRTAVWCGVHQR